jgi:hypothetical protein
MMLGTDTDPNTGLDRWRIERGGTASGGGYSAGWFATNLRTGVGAYLPTHADALRFALGQVHAQAQRIGWDLAAITDYVQAQHALAASRAGADRLRRIAGLIA